MIVNRNQINHHHHHHNQEEEEKRKIRVLRYVSLVINPVERIIQT
jgi:hypothetical protein